MAETLFGVPIDRTETDERYTPKWIFQALGERFDLDNAARNVCARRPRRGSVATRGHKVPRRGDVSNNQPHGSEHDVIENMGQLLDALDDIPYPPFEMAVIDATGRTALVYADENAVLGILRLPYEEEPCRVEALTAESFPLVRLVPELGPTDPHVADDDAPVPYHCPKCGETVMSDLWDDHRLNGHAPTDPMDRSER